MIQLIIQSIFLTIYQFIIPILILYNTSVNWRSSTICFQRIYLTNFIISLIGPHHCIALIRFYLKRASFEFEVTLLQWIVCSPAHCLQVQQNFFQTTMKVCFNFILIGNSICYILSVIIITITGLFHFIYSIRPEQQQGQIQPQIGLNDQEIELLPRVKYRQQLKKSIVVQDPALISLSEDMMCPVCLQYFVQEQICIQLPCKHIFHVECIKGWLNLKDTCPNCRINVKEQMGIHVEQNNPDSYSLSQFSNINVNS